MHEVLRQALEPILRDIATLRAPAPVIVEDDWVNDPAQASAMAWAIDGGATGIRVWLDADEQDRIAEVSDQVQEWVIEELWGTSPSNWPPCPAHPSTHPLQPKLRDGRATWVCPVAGTAIWPVGSIPRPGDEAPLP